MHTQGIKKSWGWHGLVRSFRSPITTSNKPSYFVAHKEMISNLQKSNIPPSTSQVGEYTKVVLIKYGDGKPLNETEQWNYVRSLERKKDGNTWVGSDKEILVAEVHFFTECKSYIFIKTFIWRNWIYLVSKLQSFNLN